MPRIIFKCPYIKPGTKSTGRRGHYVRYIATREGVEKIDSQATRREHYVSYIAQRPRAERIGTHGLFNGSGEPITLSRVAEEVANHPGNVWLPIISLRREDAVRLGYDNAKQWQALLSTYTMEMAAAMKIPWDQFRWYAAFHDEGTHPHIHMVCYSADGKSGFLSKEGVAQIKSGLAKEIFRQDLTEIYQRQTQRRDELVQKSSEVMEELIRQMRSGTLENSHVEQLMNYLAEQLKDTTGKKQYGYLKPSLKVVVNEIVDELAKDSRVAAAYDLWYRQREEVLRTYKDDLPPRLPLSQQKEFKRIRNLVLEEVVRLGEKCDISVQPELTAAQGAVKSPDRTVRAVTQLLHHMGRIFQEQTPHPAGGISFVDSKLRRKIREKKIAMGHKPDDHEDQIQQTGMR